ncbi:ergothioneine biosynthesis glutamate--cysteine ligase EgtA [Rhodococcus sp. 06-470-2]|uniref:ergothioneine biosynthesis glutamate--cysteine ligase EgtA n=1 Tax=unclassified Rhodococcus (in: high G+C Gram-positive bacteria) TaxID=192944 RepID=UPI000B9A5575|nr:MULTISPECIES: ergothioneine biosynthesis glutamate--cysteine ligase EgtA [unclassified Rhodococcus (in: high G+C Gram-positive bacteria)]OZC67118.1 ergothioneine biosynthesis glutamate--cysteine ligase EgtA [Rhodococcus sp. 06-470-2]OZE58790.1 ergothioneine biosynthesis glutamate--cysteine ligase EgtA [Rhodococcus sp. 05-2221-1B]
MSSNEKSLGLSSRPAAEAYVSKVCFKLGPPALVGAELEWLTALDDGTRPTLSALADALGVHSPRSIDPESPALSLPGGSIVTVEPGGQVELSSSPYVSVSRLAPMLDADAQRLRNILGDAGIDMASVPADTARAPERLLVLPRYCAMENRFTTIGPFGKLMMCNTAAAQVSVDAGRDRAEVAARWHMLHVIGPAFVSAFARSPELAGAPAGDWASQRMRTWLELDSSRTDSSRTAVPNTGDPIADYARWALDVPLLCIQGVTQNWEAPAGTTFAQWMDDPGSVGRAPTYSDLDYHLTTLFPKVRACGHFEIRYLDAQPDGQWVVPAAAFEALLSTPELVARATEIGGGTAGRWLDAARLGLADDDLRAAATELLQLAAEVGGEYSELLSAASRRCGAGEPPSEFDTATREFRTRKESV